MALREVSERLQLLVHRVKPTRSLIHRMTMRFAVDKEVRPLSLRIDDFEFAVAGRVQCGCQFFVQFRGHGQIILRNDAREEERSADNQPLPRDEQLRPAS